MASYWIILALLGGLGVGLLGGWLLCNRLGVQSVSKARDEVQRLIDGFRQPRLVAGDIRVGAIPRERGRVLHSQPVQRQALGMNLRRNQDAGLPRSGLTHRA